MDTKLTDYLVALSFNQLNENPEEVDQLFFDMSNQEKSRAVAHLFRLVIQIAQKVNIETEKCEDTSDQTDEEFGFNSGVRPTFSLSFNGCALFFDMVKEIARHKGTIQSDYIKLVESITQEFPGRFSEPLEDLREYLDEHGYAYYHYP